MAWYDTGTVSVTNGSTTVTGSGTNFVSGAQVGEAFYGPDDNLYEIEAIVSATELTLADQYLGSSQTGQDYKIVPTQSLVADLAGQVTTLINDFQTVADEAGEGKFDDGSAASPGITFTQDQDTGFYRKGANNFGVSVGGSEVGEFTSSGMSGTFSSITGTAVTQSPEDDTEGRVLVQRANGGAWGLGGLLAPIQDDFQATDQRAGFRRTQSATTNIDQRPAGTSFGTEITWRYDSKDFRRIWGNVLDDDLYHQRYRETEGGFQPWRKFYDTGNVGDTAALEGMDQGVATTDSPEFAGLTVDGAITGTAVTQSPEDDTEGRLPVVRSDGGIFGVGGVDAPEQSDFLATDKRAGFSRTTNTTPNIDQRPALVGTPFGTEISWRYGSSAFRRIWGTTVSDDLYHQRYRGVEGGFQPWRKFYDTGNVLGTIANGALIESGNNANGSYVKYADGTIICSHKLSVDNATNTRWTFPTPFTNVPHVTGTLNASGPHFVSVSNISVSEVIVRAWDDTSTRVTGNVEIVAIGE